MTDKEVVVLIGAGAIGIAIARRISAGKNLLLADLSKDALDSCKKNLDGAGFEVTTKVVDVSSRQSVEELAKTARSMGKVTKMILATGISPSHASSEKILKVDFYGAALVLEEFGKIISAKGAGIVIGSQSSHRLAALSPEQDRLLATTPTEELLKLPMLQAENLSDSLYTYQLSKRACTLRVKSEAVKWGKEGARINVISPGIIITPLSKAELSSANGDYYRRMIELCPSGRAGTAEEVASLAAFLMGPEGEFITGSDFLMDGGVSAAYWYGGVDFNS